MNKQNTPVFENNRKATHKKSTNKIEHKLKTFQLENTQNYMTKLRQSIFLISINVNKNIIKFS